MLASGDFRIITGIDRGAETGVAVLEGLVDDETVEEPAMIFDAGINAGEDDLIAGHINP